MSDVKLDEQDRENLKFILQTMYPNDRVFVEYEPNVSTLEVYVAAVKGNLFCNKAMTQLTTELAAAAAGGIYRGKGRNVVKEFLKKLSLIIKTGGSVFTYAAR